MIKQGSEAEIHSFIQYTLKRCIRIKLRYHLKCNAKLGISAFTEEVKDLLDVFEEIVRWSGEEDELIKIHAISLIEEYGIKVPGEAFEGAVEKIIKEVCKARRRKGR